MDELYRFYADIDFDLILVLYDKFQPISMAAVTSREDTGYSELNFIVSNNEYPKATELTLDHVLNELIKRNIKLVRITLEEDDSLIETVESYKFHQRSKSVFYRKELE